MCKFNIDLINTENQFLECSLKIPKTRPGDLVLPDSIGDPPIPNPHFLYPILPELKKIVIRPSHFQPFSITMSHQNV